MEIHGEFDYGKYLASKNIYGNISSYSVKKVDENKGNIFLKYIYLLRENISKRIDKELNNSSAALLKGMIYGDTKELDETVKNNFQDIGISHLTAVSGSNVSTLIIIFTMIFSSVKIKRWYADILTLIIISVFCIISSLELSIVRATIMTAILVISKLLKNNISIYITLLITITLIFISNPMTMYNVGLLLSFAATLSIVMFVMPIKDSIDKLVRKLIKSDKLFKILSYITIPMSVTIAANILIFPITIYFFGMFQGIFLISNIIASYFETSIRVTGVIAIILMKVPIISYILFQISGILCNILIYIAGILEKVSMPIYFRHPGNLFLIIYYLIFFILYIKIEKTRMREKVEIKQENYIFINKVYKVIKDVEKKLKIKNILKTLILVLIINICVLKIYYIYFDNYIYFLNIGQGDMSVIKTRDSFGVVDIGSTKKGLAASTLINFMKNKNINKIDYIIISHMHTDHINGILEILNTYKVGAVIYSYPPIDNLEYLEILKSIREKNIKSIIVDSGDNISVGKYLDINILLAGQGKIIDKDMENANSLIFDIISNKKRVIFMGDATKISGKILIESIDNSKQSEDKYNGFKVGHHGSKTSTSEDLIKRFDFSFAVISSRKEEFGHPSEETINLLNKYNIRKYITEKNGAVKYSLN